MKGRSLQAEAVRKDIVDILQNHKEIHLRLDSFVEVTNERNGASSEAAKCDCNGRRSIDGEGNKTPKGNFCSTDEEHLPELVAKLEAIGKRLDVLSNELVSRVDKKSYFIKMASERVQDSVERYKQINGEQDHGDKRSYVRENMCEGEKPANFDNPSAAHTPNMQECKINLDYGTSLRSVLTKESEDNRLVKDSHVTFEEPEKRQTAANLVGKQKAVNPASVAENNNSTARKEQVTASPKSIIIPPALKQPKAEKTCVTLQEPEFVESQYWEFAVRDEIQIGQTWKRSAGIDTIICIDISRSMMDTWDRVVDFITNFVDAVRSCQPLAVDIQEHIGVVTLGHETRVLQHMTKDYSEVLRKIHLLSPDGTSPMFWAIEMVYALAKSSGRSLDLKTNGFISYPRVILLTDGWPTDRNLSGGFDRSEPRIERMEQRSILRKIKDLHKEMPLSFYTIASGPNSNTAFLKSVAIKTGGRLCALDDWPMLGKYGSNMMLAAEVYTLCKSPGTGDNTPGSQEKAEQWLSTMWGVTEQDKEDIIALLGKEASLGEDADCIDMDDTDDDDDYDNCSTTSDDEFDNMMGFTFPRVGTRVRRGADWKWNLQDENGPGTIVGYSIAHQNIKRIYHAKAIKMPCPGTHHSSKSKLDNPGWVWVEWDIRLFAGPRKNLYRYGAEGAFDVQVVEDTRIISPGRPMAVGCQVRKGPHWKQGTDDPEAKVTGMVYYVNERLDKAKVSWSDGRRGKYSFGIPGKNEIEYCGPLTPDVPGPFRVLYSDLQPQDHPWLGCTCHECQVKKLMIQRRNGPQFYQNKDSMLQDPRMERPEESMNMYDLDRYRRQQDLQKYMQDSYGQESDVYRQDFASSPTDFLRKSDIRERSYFSVSSDLSDSSDDIPFITLATPSGNGMEKPKQGYELHESQIDQYIIDDYKSQESPNVQEMNLLNKSWHAEVPEGKESQSRLPKELLLSCSDRPYEGKKLDMKFSQSLSSQDGKRTKPNKKGNKNSKPKAL